MISTGDCFTLHNYGKPHLHIVIQEQRPGEDYGQVICVYLCSIGEKTIYDKRSILQRGDHDFVTEPSYIKYNNATIEDKKDLENRILVTYPPIDQEILDDIRSAFIAPKHYEQIRNKIHEAFNEWHMDQIVNDPNF